MKNPQLSVLGLRSDLSMALIRPNDLVRTSVHRFRRILQQVLVVSAAVASVSLVTVAVIVGVVTTVASADFPASTSTPKQAVGPDPWQYASDLQTNGQDLPFPDMPDLMTDGQ